MKKLLLPLSLWLLCSGLTGAENLVRNPGFEGAAGTNGIPGGGWWLYDGLGETELKVDRAVAHQGGASARLHAAAPAKSTLVGPKFEVAPNDELRFEAWVKGENLPANQKATYGGIAFRHADGRVITRAYFPSGPMSGEWSRISGVARAPAEAVSAEAHLGYTNAPGTIWFDDVAVTITSPVSLSLVQGARPWPGEQELTVRVANHQTNQFRGSLALLAGKAQRNLPVVLEGNASRDMQVPITLNGVGAHDYKLTLLDNDGTPMRSLQGKFRTSAPLVLFPPCPCYHLVGEGNGNTRIDVRINLNPARRAGLKLSVQVADAAGQALQPVTADASKGDTVGVDVRVPVGAAGVFGLTARLVDAAGKEVASAQDAIHVSAPAESRVSLGADGFLRVAGRPVFPIGMYNCGRYEEMAKAGFNATHEYGITTGEAEESINPRDSELKALLDQSWTNGMRMMVELPRKAIEKAKWQQVRRRIETFRHHPGLLCWGSEERVARGAAPLSHVAAMYALVRELDPDHPLVLGDTRDVIQKLQQDRRDFFPDSCMDAGIWWWYPIPLKEPDGNGLEGGANSAGLLEAPPWLTTTHSKKPLWIAIQAYQKPSLDARFPTPAEYRCQAYLSIISGVKGLFFYVGSGQKDHEGKPAGLLNKPEEGHWDYVKQLATELREFSPVLMAPVCAAKVELSPVDAPVAFTLREHEGKLYLIAANKSGQAQKVHFRSENWGHKKVEVLYETHPVKLDVDSLADEFGPLAVHVYQVD